MTPHLPDDIARCPGSGEPGAWREGCETCLRRTAPPNGPRTVFIGPPPIIAFWCEFLIEPAKDRP